MKFCIKHAQMSELQDVVRETSSDKYIISLPFRLPELSLTFDITLKLVFRD